MWKEPPGAPLNILVMGASGYVGSHLVPALLQRGHRVRAAGRNRDTLASRQWDAESVMSDVLDPTTLPAVLDGIDVAYYLVHSMGSGKGYATRDRNAAENFRTAAANAGVKRIIYLGGIQAAGPPSQHLLSRKETGDILRAGPVPVTEVRAGIIVGPGSAAFEVIRDLVLHLPVMTTPRWVRSRTQPIALADLIEYLVRLPEMPETAGQIYNVAGPEVLTYEEMLRQYAATVGRRIRIIRLAVLTPRLSSYWLDLVTAVPANIARPLIDGLRFDLIVDDSPIRALIPIQLHIYREAVETALRAEREDAVNARWAEGSRAMRIYRPDASFYSKRLVIRRESIVPAPMLWQEVVSLGGKRGWAYWNWLWRLRGLLDRMIGGIGMRRGRRHPTDVRPGEAIDFWRVAEVDGGRRLVLLAEMKLPGVALLEFEVEPRQEGSVLQLTARYHPAGLFGLAYWYALKPVHDRLLPGLADSLVLRAEQAYAGEKAQ